MKKTNKITHLFIDLGGVLLTNGWDHNSRNLAMKTFKLDPSEVEYRHRLNFDTYEEGKAHVGGLFESGYLLSKKKIHALSISTLYI